MSFFKLTTPTYEIVLPSTQEKVKFRPYTVGEEKLLMIAVESDSMVELTRALEQIIQNCTFDKLDSSKMTAFDMEYLFAQLRSKSVGEISTVGIKCSSCSKSNRVEVDMSKARVDGVRTDPKDFLVEVEKNVKVKLKYPSLKDTFNIMNNLDDMTPTQVAYDNIIASIDEVYAGEEVYSTEGASRQDLEQFVDSMKPQAFQDIKKLLDEIPSTVIDVSFKCTHCSHDNEYRAKGIINFFA